jgi:hypothetical protein
MPNSLSTASNLLAKSVFDQRTDSGTFTCHSRDIAPLLMPLEAVLREDL